MYMKTYAEKETAELLDKWTAERYELEHKIIEINKTTKDQDTWLLDITSAELQKVNQFIADLEGLLKTYSKPLRTKPKRFNTYAPLPQD